MTSAQTNRLYFSVDPLEISISENQYEGCGCGQVQKYYWGNVVPPRRPQPTWLKATIADGKRMADFAVRYRLAYPPGN